MACPGKSSKCSISSSCILSRKYKSSAEKGSSRRIISGSLAKMRAKATLCCCPPESSAGKRFSSPESSIFLSSLKILSDLLSLGSLNAEEFAEISLSPLFPLFQKFDSRFSLSCPSMAMAIFSHTVKWGKRA